MKKQERKFEFKTASILDVVSGGKSIFDRLDLAFDVLHHVHEASDGSIALHNDPAPCLFGLDRVGASGNAPLSGLAISQEAQRVKDHQQS